MSAPKNRFSNGPSPSVFAFNLHTNRLPSSHDAKTGTVTLIWVDCTNGLRAGLTFTDEANECPDRNEVSFRAKAVIQRPDGSQDQVLVEGMTNLKTGDGYFCRLPDEATGIREQIGQDELDDLATEMAVCDL